MKKLMFLLFALSCMAFMELSAQNVISGKVTDRKGNPIPGARVKGMREAGFTVTEPDGTFRLETKYPVRKIRVDYVGFQPKKIKTFTDMDIKMTKTNLWNRKPSRMEWFINLQTAIDPVYDVPPVFGVMFGLAKGFGWYGKVILNQLGASSDYYIDKFDLYHYVNPSLLWTTGKERFSFISVSAGFVCRLGCALHLYGGVGAAYGEIQHELAGGKYLSDIYTNFIAIDTGLMLRLGRVNVNFGTILLQEVFMCNFGIGINL